MDVLVYLGGPAEGLRFLKAKEVARSLKYLENERKQFSSGISRRKGTPADHSTTFVRFVISYPGSHKEDNIENSFHFVLHDSQIFKSMHYICNQKNR